MATRVVQIATGIVGTHCLRETILHPGLDLAGVLVFSPEKVGLDAGELVGLPPTGILATDNFKEIVALEADIAIHCVRLHPDPSVPDNDVLELLESGKNVISTVGYLDPASFGAEYLGRFEAACLLGNSTLFGTGINPGFLLERVTPLFAASTVRVESIQVDEYFNLADDPSSDVVCLMLGIGQMPTAFDQNGPIAEAFGRLFNPSLRLLARRLGVEFDVIDFQQEVALAETTERILATTIEEGTVGAVRWKWLCSIGESVVVQFTLHHRGATHLKGEWDFEDHWQIAIKGDPGMTIKYEMEAPPGGRKLEAAALQTAAMVINAIPEVVAAPPGVLQASTFGLSTRVAH